ncbi:MAG: CHAT domain-containing protein [Streptosporangiaceae bacterium]
MTTRDLILTTLGAANSGRSTFLLGVYAILSAGLYGYFTFTEDPDQDIDLLDAWGLLIEEGELPPPTGNENKHYRFVFKHGLTPLITIDWMDYGGDALNDANESASDGAELRERLDCSDSIYLVLDGGTIAGWLDDPSKRAFVQEKLRVRAMSSLVLQAVRNRHERGLPPPSLAVLITKADLLRGPGRSVGQALAMVVEALPDMLPVAGVPGVTAFVCPVKVGDFGLGSAETVDASSVDPVGLHQPIIFSLMHYLTVGHGRRALTVDQASASLSQVEEQIAALERGFAAHLRGRRAAQLRSAAGRINSIESDQRQSRSDQDLISQLSQEIQGYPIIHAGKLADFLDSGTGDDAGGEAHGPVEIDHAVADVVEYAVEDHACASCDDGYGYADHAESEIVDHESAPAPTPQPDRLLVGEMPSRIRVGKELSLIVSITVKPPGRGQTAVLIPGLSPGKEGTQVTLIVGVDAGLLILGDQQQTVTVPQRGDSPPLRFAFLAQGVGLSRVRVSAWLGGTFLAELQLEVSIESIEPVTGRQRYSAPLAAFFADPGEVTLQVRSDGTRYSFQLLSQRYLFSPVVAESLTEEPGQAVERTVAMLRKMAGGGTGYTPKLAARWIRETGIGLWQDLVPRPIQDQFWELRASITSFNIACEDDRVPWELLYPLSPADDEGFLVEQFPVLRRVYGQCRSDRISLGDAQYVVPPGSPQNAEDEVAAVGRILGQSVESVITDLAKLLEALDSGSIGLLHFACHNTFSPETGGSSINMAGGAFVPRLLNSAVGRRCLAGRSPLVFINACRSAGVSPEYTQMMSWASQFMAAGAGAFIGTLWPVRSSRASVFAETFYGALTEGENLGWASMIARNATKEGGDPTWLAYTTYGDPAAVALRNSKY